MCTKTDFVFKDKFEITTSKNLIANLALGLLMSLRILLNKRKINVYRNKSIKTYKRLKTKVSSIKNKNLFEKPDPSKLLP